MSTSCEPSVGPVCSPSQPLTSRARVSFSRGVGAIGTLLAQQLATHALRPAAPSPGQLTLLLKSRAALETFRRGQSTLKLTDASGPGPAVALPPYLAEAEALEDLPASPSPSSSTKSAAAAKEPITTLVTTLKCPAVLPALRQLAPRLSAQSTVVLLHNGMGLSDVLVRSLWPDAAARPALVQGITSAGARSMGPFDVRLEGRGAWNFAVLPPFQGPLDGRSADPPPPPASLAATTALLTLLARAPGALVQPTWQPLEHLREKQYLKLAVNALVNPLTALLRVPNGALGLPALGPVLDALAEETSAVLLALTTDDDVHGAPRPLLDRETFAPEALKQAALAVASRTATNRSSMLADVDHGRPTEVDYINGHVVRLAEGAGVGAPLNARLRDRVAALGGGGEGATAKALTVEELAREFAGRRQR